MKQKKLPKSMGACADLLYDMKQQRLAADRYAAELKAEEERIKAHIIDNLDKNSTGAAGKHHRVQVVRKTKPRVDPEKWPQFLAWVAKNKAWDMLQRRVGEEGCRVRMEEGKKVPGLTTFQYVDVSLTKV
jgi:hypothetical protein